MSPYFNLTQIRNLYNQIKLPEEVPQPDEGGEEVEGEAGSLRVR